MRTLVEYYIQAFVPMTNMGPKGWVMYYADPMSLSKALKVLKGLRETDLITPYCLLKKTTTWEEVTGEGTDDN